MSFTLLSQNGLTVVRNTITKYVLSIDGKISVDQDLLNEYATAEECQMKEINVQFFNPNEVRVFWVSDIKN